MSVRHRALDRLRALAVVSMVQGHTFTALLARDALSPAWQQAHDALHGLTAPAFLLGAGVAFGVATYPRYAAHRAGGVAHRARLRRYAGLWLLGYALQLPGASLLAAFRLSGSELEPVLRVGPLHLIAVCLTVCQIGVRVLPTPRLHAAATLALALAVMAASPWVYASSLGSAAGPLLGPWLDASRGSSFPIFPWASFALLGVAAGQLVACGPAWARRAHGWALPGLLLGVGSYLLFLRGVRLCPSPWFWHASPLHVVFRVGLVACLMALLHPWKAPPQASAMLHGTAGLGALLARRSLVAYVVHLLLLYGTPYTPNLVHRYGQQLSLGAASAVFAAVLAITILCARAWDGLARGRTGGAGWVQIALAVLGLLVILR